MKTLLSNAINSCGIFYVNGYEIDDVQMETPIVVTLPDDDLTLYFDDCEIEIDDDGDAKVLDTEGDEHSFAFKVTSPMREQDLIKRPS